MAKYFKGAGILWDPEKNAVAVDFTEDPIQAVDDERIIELLQKNGFVEVEKPKDQPKPGGKNETKSLVGSIPAAHK